MSGYAADTVLTAAMAAASCVWWIVAVNVTVSCTPLGGLPLSFLDAHRREGCLRTLAEPEALQFGPSR